MNDPNYIDPLFALLASGILFLLLAVIILVQARRAKIRRRKAARRESFEMARLTNQVNFERRFDKAITK